MSDNYLNELKFDDLITSKIFFREIDRRIENKIKELCKFDKSYSAKVVAVGTGVADIILQGGTNTITNVKNKSGETLIVNDEVIIEAINNSLNNIYIKLKK